MYYLKQIPSETLIKKFLQKTIFQNELHCPKCRSASICRYEKRFRCKNCRFKFSLLSSTFLLHLRLPLSQFWLILWCWVFKVPIKQTAFLSGLSIPTIYHWFQTFKSKLPIKQKILEDLVQMNKSKQDSNTIILLRSLLLNQQPSSRKSIIIINKPRLISKKAWSHLKNDTKPTVHLSDYFWPLEHNFEQINDKGALRLLRKLVTRVQKRFIDSKTFKPLYE